MISRTPQRLLEFYDLIFEPEELAGRSPKTKKVHACAITRFADFLERAPLVSDLTASELIRCCEWHERRGYSKGIRLVQSGQFCCRVYN